MHTLDRRDPRMSAFAWGAALALVQAPGAAGAVTPADAAPRVMHLAASGRDDATGTAQAPWRTLARLQQAIDAGQVRAGDQVLLRRGDRFGGHLVLGPRLQGLPARPIVLGATGEGAAPVLHGWQALGPWTPAGAGRWRAACPGCAGTPALLALDGRPQPIARWPNRDEADEGWRYFTATNGRNEITDPDLRSQPNWVGGEMVLRPTPWVIDRVPIVAQRTDTLVGGQDASYPLSAGWGYFVQNHPAAIDREGEWAYEATTASVLLQSATDPNTRRVEVPALDVVLDVRGAAQVVLQDLVVEGACRRAIDASGCSGLQVRRVRAAQAGERVVSVADCPATLLQDVRVEDGPNVGLHLPDCADCRVAGAQVRRIGLDAGMGANGDGAYLGVELGGRPGQPMRASDLVVRQIGYLGISLRGQATLQRSQISDYNRVKTDGAGIYSYRVADLLIQDNLVTDAPGSRAGTNGAGVSTHGIYIDDDSERVQVRGNTVARVGSAGIFLHNTRDVVLADNLVHDAAEAGVLMVDDDLGAYAVERTTLRRNTIVVRQVPVLSLQRVAAGSPYAALSPSGRNLYCDPFGDALWVVGSPQGGTATLGLAQWQRDSGNDATSTRCDEGLPTHLVQGLPGPDRVTNGRFDTDLSGWFGWPAPALDARWETGRLDGGSLRLAHAGSAGIVHFDHPVGAVSAGQTWLAQFDTAPVAGEVGLQVYLRQSGPPYADLAARQRLLPAAGRAAHQVFLDVATPEADTLLIFELSQPGLAIGIDNVRLQAVNATPQPLSAVSRLETNPRATPRRVAIGTEDWHAVDGTNWPAGSTLTLEPYRSVVLLRGAAR